jgi:flagellar assembly factor FliW
LSVPAASTIRLPQGLIGFSHETEFVIIERTKGPVAFLQSLRTPELALPILDASFIRPEYPSVPLEDIARLAGANPANTAILVVVAVAAPDPSLRANLLAPIVIDSVTRSGAQVILAGTEYGASVPIGPVAPAGTEPTQSAKLAFDAR